MVTQGQNFSSSQLSMYVSGLLRKKLLIRGVPYPFDLPLHVRKMRHVMDPVTGLDAIGTAVLIRTRIDVDDHRPVFTLRRCMGNR